jgi:glycosyltransferase involved in cell wall biosynthesis
VNISIITAVFNRSSTIVQAVKSVQQQTHPDVEHVVIDGASTDGTLQLLHECLHDGAILVSEPDCGMYDAINKGIVRSSGDIIGLMHSDDVYANKHVLADVADIFADSEIDAVYGDVAFFRSSNPAKLVRRYRSDVFNPERLAWGWVPAHTALFLRRRIFEQYGFYKTNYKIASDYEFMARIFRTKVIRSKYLPNVLVHMRIGGVSTGGWRNTVILNQEVLRACRENGIKTNMLKILSKYPLKIMEFL